MKEIIGRQSISGYLFVILLVTILQGCSKSDYYVDSENVKEIKIAYLPKGINPDMAISKCEDIFEYPKVLIKDTIISDREYIKNFIRNVNELEESEKPINYDFRINCLMVLEKGKYKQICFGEDHLIVLDGKLMRDNQKLIDLINKTLY